MSTQIAVAARLRPWIHGEFEDDTVSVSEGDGTVSVTEGSKVSKFSFKSCYGQNATQEMIFNKDVQPLIANAYRGLMVTIFAYGVTSSGKTHTMQGNREDPGIIPRVVKELFARRDSLSLAAQNTVQFHLSYMEVYKDDVYDLFIQRQTASKLSIMTNEHGQTTIPRLTHKQFHAHSEFQKLYDIACKARSVASTNLNRASSRSHAILGITVSYADESTGLVLTGKINLVDLAGSENNKMTGNDASRMAESAAINKSLTTLGMVVKALNRNEGRIPYRDSKLTRILQDALGGSSIGVLICNLAPGKKFVGDTINTLNFAGMAKSIENKPVVNSRAIIPAAPIIRIPVAPVPFNFPNHGNRRGSLLPVPSASSAIPLLHGGGYRRASMLPEHPPTLTEKEIEERISRAVELEVAKRLEEKEQERELERKRELDAIEEEMKKNELELEMEGLENESDLGSEQESDPVEDMEVEQRQASDVLEQGEIDEEIEVEPVQAEQEPAIPSITVTASGSVEPMTPRKTSSSGQGTTPQGLTLPSQVLDSLLYKHHRSHNVDLVQRLAEVEQKYAKGDHLKLADVLSPVSKHKTARAYVELARSSQDRGDTRQALEMYKKAAAYKPDNQKLSNRIFEMELAVIQGVAHQPKRRSHRSSSRHSSSHGNKTSPYENVRSKTKPASRGEPLGELTNSPKKDRRRSDAVVDGTLPNLKSGGEKATPKKVINSPDTQDWFMAPRKGGIGKAR